MNLFPAYESTSPLTQDAALQEMFGDDEHVAPTASRALSPEQRLMLDVLTQAIEEARSAKRPRAREDAQLWLRGADARLTAELCCEALGIDYEAMMARLEATWKQI